MALTFESYQSVAEKELTEQVREWYFLGGMINGRLCGSNLLK